MDFAVVDKAFRIKTKTITIVVDPQKGSKVEADAAIFTSEGQPISSVRLNVPGPGEYEVGGVKISTKRWGDGMFHEIEGDNLKVGVGRMSLLASNQDKLPNCQIIVVDADSQLTMESIIATEPSVIVVYGQNSAEAQKISSSATSANKFSVTLEKLPQETQTVVIG